MKRSLCKQNRNVMNINLPFPFFWLGLEFEFRASHLQSRFSTIRATPLVYFSLVILEMGSQELFAQADLKP
jgi:hypothetical protein